MRTVSFLPLLAAIAAAQSPFYNVPDPLIEPLKPRGLRISIPDEPGVELFAVHANVNKPLQNLEGGQISQDITKAKNGRWTYEDIRVRLKPGDVINYWLYVQADGLGYRKDDQTFTVTELVDPGTTPNNPKPDPTPPKPTPSKPTTTTPSVPCENSVTTKNGKQTCQGQLIFEENFAKLNPSKWQHVVQLAYTPDYQFVVYTDNGQNSYVKKNTLFITPTLLSPNDENYIYTGKLDLAGCTGIPNTEECVKQARSFLILPVVQSAKLRTKLSFNFKYGVIEIRAKLPAGDWLFPEIWLEPKDSFYGRDGYESGQIRIASARGNRDLSKDGVQIGNNLFEAGCRIGLNKKIRNEFVKKTSNSPWAGEFHTYKLIWTEDQLVFVIDGSQVGTVTPPLGGFGGYAEFASAANNPWRSKIAPFDREFYISLGVGVGGKDEFPDGCKSGQHPKPWKNNEAKALFNFWRDRGNWHQTWKEDSHSLQVDYIKVWAL